MKKRNLKFLLALVAALALVFAAGCDNSGENASAGAYESTYSASTWVYTAGSGDTHGFPRGEKLSPCYTLKSVTLKFPPTSTDCDISVEYIACTYVEGKGTHSDSNDTKDTETVAATYVATDNGVVVTLDSNVLTFTYEAPDSDNNTPAALALTGVPDGASYTIYTIGGDFDIFDVYGGLDCNELEYTRFYCTTTTTD